MKIIKTRNEIQHKILRIILFSKYSLHKQGLIIIILTFENI